MESWDISVENDIETIHCYDIVIWGNCSSGLGLMEVVEGYVFADPLKHNPRTQKEVFASRSYEVALGHGSKEIRSMM